MGQLWCEMCPCTVDIILHCTLAPRRINFVPSHEVFHTHTHTHTGQYLLQLRVVICFLILAAGRVINVYVPLYYKNIVNALTPNYYPGGNHTNQLDVSFSNHMGIGDAGTGIVFPLVSICIYVLLKFLQVSDY